MTKEKKQQHLPSKTIPEQNQETSNKKSPPAKKYRNTDR